MKTRITHNRVLCSVVYFLLVTIGVLRAQAGQTYEQFTAAHSGGVVRIGVTPLQNAPVGLSPTAARDRLVKDLNKQKKPHVEAVPLDSSAGQHLSDEAKQKNCEFVVYSTLAEANTQGENTAGGAFDMATPQEHNVPNFHATIEYKVYRTSDLTAVASGSARAQGIGSQAAITGEALDNVAKKASADIMKAGDEPATR